MPKESFSKNNPPSPSIMDEVSNFFAGLWQQAHNAGKSIRKELEQNSFGKETVTVLDELAEGVSNFGVGTINFIRSGMQSEAMKNIGKGAALMGEGLFQGAKGVTNECVQLGAQAGKAIDKGIHSQTAKDMEAGAVALGREAVIVGGQAAKMVGRGAIAVGHGAIKAGEEGARLMVKGGELAGEGALLLGHESVAVGKVVGKAIDSGVHSEAAKMVGRGTVAVGHGAIKAGEEGARIVTKGAALAGQGALLLGHESVAVGKVVGKAIDSGVHSEAAKMIGHGTVAVGHGAIKAGEEGARIVTKGALLVGHESVAAGKVMGKVIDASVHSETVKHIEKGAVVAVSGVAKAAVHAGQATAKAVDEHVKVKIIEK